jgi:hypothetical protein
LGFCTFSLTGWVRITNGPPPSQNGLISGVAGL